MTDDTICVFVTRYDTLADHQPDRHDDKAEDAE